MAQGRSKREKNKKEILLRKDTGKDKGGNEEEKKS